MTMFLTPITAQPDEWLLCIRDGKLIKAGVGIRLWPRPFDAVARFSSTLQRVSFTVEALSVEQVRVAIEGFILWSVSPEGDGPFRAFQKMGLVNLALRGLRSARSEKHLLTTPQHHAFQKLIGSLVQRLAGTHTLDSLLLGQDALVAEMRTRLAFVQHDLGVCIEQIELSRVRPCEPEILAQLAAQLETQLEEDAARIRAASQERIRRQHQESEARLAEEQLAIARKTALAKEALAVELAQAEQAREELQLSNRLERQRREAVGARDCALLLTAAEEQKSAAVREHELSRLCAEKLGDALKNLHDARWITVGADSPAASLAALFTTARELCAPK
jgi:flotillin